MNRAGEPTSDPGKILEGALLSAAGLKGCASVLIIDMLSGVLTSPPFGSSVGDIYEDSGSPQGVKHFIRVHGSDDLEGKDGGYDFHDNARSFLL